MPPSVPTTSAGVKPPRQYHPDDVRHPEYAQRLAAKQAAAAEASQTQMFAAPENNVYNYYDPSQAGAGSYMFDQASGMYYAYGATENQQYMQAGQAVTGYGYAVDATAQAPTSYASSPSPVGLLPPSTGAAPNANSGLLPAPGPLPPAAPYSGGPYQQFYPPAGYPQFPAQFPSYSFPQQYPSFAPSGQLAPQPPAPFQPPYGFPPMPTPPVPVPPAMPPLESPPQSHSPQQPNRERERSRERDREADQGEGESGGSPPR